MKKRWRLAGRREFDRVLGSRRVLAGRALVAYAAPAVAGQGRVGVAVSRKIRGAVLRNRARRRLREAARLLGLVGPGSPQGLGIGYDVVLIARPAALELPFTELAAEVARVRARLERRG